MFRQPVNITYERQTWEQLEHVGYKDGLLQVQANDVETANALLKALGGRVTVKNEEEMHTVMDFINEVGIDKVTNAINQSHGTAPSSSRPKAPQPGAAGRTHAPPIPGAPPPPPPPPPRPPPGPGAPPPPPPQAPSTPKANSGGGGGGGSFLDDIKNFKKHTLKTATLSAPAEPAAASAGDITIDSLGDALANLLAKRRGHLNADTDSDEEW